MSVSKKTGKKKGIPTGSKKGEVPEGEKGIPVEWLSVERERTENPNVPHYPVMWVFVGKTAHFGMVTEVVFYLERAHQQPLVVGPGAADWVEWVRKETAEGKPGGRWSGRWAGYHRVMQFFVDGYWADTQDILDHQDAPIFLLCGPETRRRNQHLRLGSKGAVHDPLAGEDTYNFGGATYFDQLAYPGPEEGPGRYNSWAHRVLSALPTPVDAGARRQMQKELRMRRLRDVCQSVRPQSAPLDIWVGIEFCSEHRTFWEHLLVRALENGGHFRLMGPNAAAIRSALPLSLRQTERATEKIRQTAPKLSVVWNKEARRDAVDPPPPPASEPSAILCVDDAFFDDELITWLPQHPWTHVFETVDILCGREGLEQKDHTYISPILWKPTEPEEEPSEEDVADYLSADREMLTSGVGTTVRTEYVPPPINVRSAVHDFIPPTPPVFNPVVVIRANQNTHLPVTRRTFLRQLEAHFRQAGYRVVVYVSDSKRTGTSRHEKYVREVRTATQCGASSPPVVLYINANDAFGVDHPVITKMMDPVVFPNRHTVEVVTLSSNRAYMRGTVGDLALTATGAEYVFATLRQVHALTWATATAEERLRLPSSFRTPTFDMFPVLQPASELLPVAVAVTRDVPDLVLANSWRALSHHLRRNGLEPVLLHNQRVLGYPQAANRGQQSAVLAAPYGKAIPLLLILGDEKSRHLSSMGAPAYPLTWDTHAMGYQTKLEDIDAVLEQLFRAVKQLLREDHPLHERFKARTYDNSEGPLHPRFNRKDGPHNTL